MEEFPYYGLSWFAYLLLSASFLLLSIWKSKNLNQWLRIPLLTLIAAMAFTPATTIQGEAFWSPAAIVMVFEIDQYGLNGFWRAGLGIIMVWLVLMIGTFATRWFIKRRGIKLAKPTPETRSEPDLKEPE